MAFKEGADVLLAAEIGLRQLVRQQEFAPVMALGYAVPDGGFRLSADIAVRGVKVVEPGGDEGVRHTAEFIVIHMPVFHGQTHHL